MFSRSLVSCLIGAAAFAAHGQSCFRIVDAMDHRALAGCKAYCSDGTLAGISDSTGQLCVPSTCAQVELKAERHEALRMGTMEAVLAGVVAMERDANELPAAIVEPWPRKEDRHALAATTNIDSTLLANSERSSLRSAALLSPGVQWDERGQGGSNRLSIRGSVLRSPYGVRGVKVFWGPFPLTLADGSTPLELLDPITTGSVDIVRSVGSPVYGSAPSGMLLATAPFREAQGNDVAVEGSGGSYGFFRASAVARTTHAKNAFSAGVVHQGNDGYRDQESSARDQAFITSRSTRKNSTTQLFLTWQNASWGLPGSVDENTAKDHPQEARPYSEAINAHIDKQQLMGGIATEVTVGRHLRVRSGVDAQIIDKQNPYGTSPANCGFKDESIRTVAARSSLSGTTGLFQKAFSWEMGLEALFDRDRLKEHAYVYAVMGDLKTDADTRVTNLNAFAMTTTRLSARTTLHAGVGIERTQYDQTDHLLGTEPVLKSTAVPCPIIGAEQLLGHAVHLHLRYAESTSRPTVWELLGTTGRFNTALHGEHVREWELGIDGPVRSTEDGVEATLYRRTVEGMITQVTAADGFNQEYVNIGNATITGLELRLRGSPIGGSGRTMFTLVLGGQIGQVEMPSSSGANVVTNGIPGTPDLTAALQVNGPITGNGRSRLQVGVRGASGVLPTIGSTATIGAYHVEQARYTYSTHIGLCPISVFMECENLLDIRYTSWIQVSDPGGRYYNPAPGRSFFGGIRFVVGSRDR